MGISMGAAAPAPLGFDDHEPTTRASPQELLAARAAAAAPPVAPASAPAPAPAAPQGRSPQRTMLGIAGPGFGVPVPPSAPVAPSAAAAAPASALPVAAPAAAPMVAAAAPVAPAPIAPVAPAPIAPAPVAPLAEAPAVAASASPPGAAAAKKLGPSHRTMLGVAAPAAPGAASAPPAAPATSLPAPAPTMDTGEMSIAGMPSPRRRFTGCLVGLLALGLLVSAIAVGAVVYTRFFGRGPAVRATVGQSAEGDVLRLELPDAAAGTVVRYGGQERPVESGRVELPMAAGALRLGDNELVVEVVSGGAATQVPITLTLEYRVRTDLAGLEATPPALHVVVEALPGSTATLGGQPVTLSPQGQARVEVPLASLTPGPDGTITHSVAYVVTPPGGGSPASGTVSTRIPMARLELRHPLDGAVTDQATVEVVGRTAPAAAGQAATQVRVEGVEATVAADGTFRVVAPLPEAGEAGRAVLHVVAHRPGAAPRALEVGIRRVADMRRAAAELPVDRALTYDRVVDAPDQARGRYVALEGQVYNVDVQDGRGILQMLVRGCTRPDRCPLWVTYAPAGPIETGTVVRVVGTGAGTQQFRAESGEVRTVPSVEASYVLVGGP
jgi:hypothetical protein